MYSTSQLSTILDILKSMPSENQKVYGEFTTNEQTQYIHCADVNRPLRAIIVALHEGPLLSCHKAMHLLLDQL